MHERMSKLVSVSQTVEHSSTIISDILSRILNETVMREETICRICFDLLNDIDYHLKEAQEKTDEITAKFLDKEKDPLNYRPQPIVTASSESSPASAAAANASASLKREQANKALKKKSAATSKSGGRVKSSQQHQQNSSSRKRKQSEVQPAAPAPQPQTDYDTDGGPLTEDEMSVNVINRNKQKLLSHVLNPRLVKKEEEEEDTEQEEDEDAEEEEEDEEAEDDPEDYYESKWKRKKGKENRKESKRRKRLKLQEQTSITEAEFAAAGKTSASSQPSEFATVNMDELGDLFSKPKPPVYFAKKSDPAASAAVKRERQSEEAGAEAAGPEPLRCGQCSKVFKKKCNLVLHMEKVHQVGIDAVYSESVPETHKCPLCPREFTNPNSLAAHKEEHKVLEKKPVIANVKVVRSAPVTTPAEGDEVKATCPQCHKTFRRLFNMRIHVDRVHKKIKPFPCTKCDKSFATNSDLRQHMTVHGEGKVFECEECGRTFSNRDSIILHQKQHRNERTHFCMVCDKGFFKSSCLTRHMRTHTGERPYVCNYCNKGFSQCTTLKTHKAKCKLGQREGADQRAIVAQQQQQAILGL